MTTMRLDATALAPAAGTVADARENARRFLETLQQPVLNPETADAVLLVVSELITNALRHGGGTWTLRLTAHPGLIEVAVSDLSPQAPLMRNPDLTGATGGFGWRMVKHLSRTTTVTHQPSAGKTVSAFLAR
ncbi:ATP-binding protein [Streptomyces sp. ID05-18]|uniref:ATP-binding protein n=1 Tax=Streptomyces sp. ID05-18 TaxID=3028662 RepID=UPI0029A3686D|nr:ATP-binding protein [Streptomyces sp. ID05-18]MDX3488469.1 ATP-binding protein [Streptomyces sp. ID05-18]